MLRQSGGFSNAGPGGAIVILANPGAKAAARSPFRDVETTGLRQRTPAPYFIWMSHTPKRSRPQLDSAVQNRKDARAARHKRIASGQTPGLFVSGAKRLRPEIEEMIRAAVADRAGNA